MCPAVGLPLERIVPSGGASFCGVQLPAGTIVGVNAAVIHYDTDIFGPDADQFRPERWLQTSEEDGERIRRMDRCNLTVSTTPVTALRTFSETMYYHLRPSITGSALVSLGPPLCHWVRPSVTGPTLLRNSPC
jgi:hypothetical protein